MNPVRDRRVSIGLALSGGAARSTAHIGVLQALEEARIRPDYLTGTSGGAIVGAVYAAGLRVDEIRQIAAGLRWKQLAWPVVPRLGLLSNAGIQRFLADLLGDVTFADLHIPLSVVATDLRSGRKVVFCEGPVARAVMLSTCIPTVFEPIVVGDAVYVDGGLVEYLPVETVRGYRPDVVIAVNLGQRDAPLPKPRHLLHVSMAVCAIASQRNMLVSEGLADVVIRPRTAPFASFDLRPSKELMEIGYQAGRRSLPDIEAAVSRARAVRPRAPALVATAAGGVR